MAEFIDSFNANSKEVKIEILRHLITQACSLMGQVALEDEAFFKIDNLEKNERNALRKLLEGVPHVKLAIKVIKDPENWSRYVIKISKREYLANLPFDHLHHSLSLKDSERYDPRLDVLDRETHRSWYETQSAKLGTEVVSLMEEPPEPASRAEQMDEMGHQLLGDSKSAIAERKDWLGHVIGRDGNNGKTVIPSNWATRGNVSAMEGRLNYNKEERARLERVLQSKGRE